MNAEKEASFKTKETLKIQFTCILIDDNHKKLKLIEKLKGTPPVCSLCRRAYLSLYESFKVIKSSIF